jgi:hypothetical protein
MGGSFWMKQRFPFQPIVEIVRSCGAWTKVRRMLQMVSAALAVGRA